MVFWYLGQVTVSLAQYKKRIGVLALLLTILLNTFVVHTPLAQAAIAKYINFQGKLTKVSDGTNMANGTYAFEFKIYDALTSGSLLWTETYDQGSGACAKLSVTNGVFNAKLGSCNALTGVDFTSNSLYISVNFAPTGTSYDGEMSPRKQLVAAAYAFNANSVVGDGKLGLTSTATTGDANNLTNSSFAPAASASGNLINLTFSNTSSNGSGTSTVNGIALTPTVNVTSGAGTHNTIGINLGTVTNTACSAGTCNKYGIYAPSSNNYTDLFNYNGTSLINGSGQINASQLLAGTVPSSVITGSYTGITGVGTVTAGTWNGTAIGAQYGGTGINTSASTGVPSISSGTWSVAATLSVTLGGTGASSFTANGVLYGNGTSAVGVTAAGTTGQCLVATTSAAPSWGACGSGTINSGVGGYFGYYPSTGTTIDDQAVLYTNGTNIGVGDTSPTALFTVGSGDLFQVDSSGGLKFNGVTTDITTGTNEALLIAPNGTGSVIISSSVTSGSGSGSGLFATSSTVTSGTVITFSSTSDNTSGSTQQVLNVANSGNSNGNLTYGASISNSKSGSGINIALDLAATGGAANYALYAASGNNYFGGNVGVGINAPTSQLHIQQAADSTNTTTPVAFDANSVGTSGELTASSGTQTFARIAPIVNQSGSSGYTALLVNATETATGSGAHFLLNLQTGGSDKFNVQSDGTVVTASTIFGGNDVYALGSGKIGLQNRSVFSSATDGNLMVSNNANNNFGLLQLGGTSSSFPAIKRNGAAINLRLADDSGYANVAFGTVTAGTWNGTAINDTYVADTLTIDSSSSVHWNALSNYPTACSAGSAISTLADSPTCTAFNTDTSITLQDAYGQGGTIETASNTPVIITETTAATNTGDLLQLTSNAATGGTHSGDLLQLTLDAVDANGYTGNGINIIIDQSQNTGNAILVQDDAATTLFQLDENGGLTLGAASSQTTAITITDSDYTNALSIADNNITGTTFTIAGTTAAISFTDFSVDSDGKVTIAPDTTGDAITLTGFAGDFQGIVIDASTADTTATGGQIQITADTVTDGAVLGVATTGNIRDAAGNLTAVYGNKATLTIDTDAGQSHTAYGQHITIANNDTSSTAYGLYVDAGTGAGTEYAAVLLNGNVGIGTTTPTAGKIHVVAASTTQVPFLVQQPTANNNFEILKAQRNDLVADYLTINYQDGNGIRFIGNDNLNISAGNGSLNLTSNTASTYAIPANTTNAFRVTDGTNAYQTIDTRTGTSGVSAITLTPGTAPSIASGASTYYIGTTITPGTQTYTGTTNTTSTGTSSPLGALINQLSVAGNGTRSITEASTFAINGAVRASSSSGTETITSSYGLNILAGSALNGTNGAVTNGYGLSVNAPTGASNNYSAIFQGGNLGIGDTSPTALLTVGSGDLFQVNSSGAIAAATGISSSGTINFSGLTASSAVYTDGSKNLTSTAPTSGTIGYWSRSSTTLQPATSNDIVAISSNTVAAAGILDLTASGTITSGNNAIRITANSVTSGNGISFSGTGITTGNALNIALGSGVTSGSAINITASGTSAIANGLLQITHSGAFTSTGGLMNLVGNSSTSGTLATVSGTSITTGTILNVAAGAGITSGAALKVSASGTSAIANGLMQITHSGAYTSTGGLLNVNSSASTAGTLVNFTNNTANFTGIALNLSTTGISTGTAMQITGGGSMSTGQLLGLVMGTASTGNALNITANGGAYTGTGLQTFNSNSLTSGTMLSIAANGASQTSAKFIDIAQTGVTTGFTGNLINLSSTSTTGAATFINLTANSSTVGTGQAISMTGLTTGRAQSITLGSALTTGGLLSSTGASYNPGAGNTGNLISLAFTNAGTSTSGTAIVTGVNLAPTISASGTSGTHDTYSIRIQDAAGTPSNGTQNIYGIRIGNQGRSGAEASYGLYIDPQSGSSGNYGAYIGSSLGVGTATTPSSTLHVKTSSDTNVLIEGTGSGSSSGVEFLNGSRDWYIGMSSTLADDSWSIRDVTGNARRLLINTSGNIGINKTTPSERLNLSDGSNVLLDSGYLITPQGGFGRSENRIKYTEEFDNAAWTKTGVTVTANSTTGPDGYTFADTLGAGGSSTDNVKQADWLSTSSTSTTWTGSVWLKKASGTGTVNLRLDSGNQTGTANTVTVTTSWQRFSVTQSFNGSSTGTVTFIINNGTTAYYAWGAQLEKQSTAGIYVRNGSRGNTGASNGLVVNGRESVDGGETTTSNAFTFNFDGWAADASGYTTGMYIRSLSDVGYAPYHVRTFNEAYDTYGSIATSNASGLDFSTGGVSTGARYRFSDVSTTFATLQNTAGTSMLTLTAPDSLNSEAVYIDTAESTNTQPVFTIETDGNSSSNTVKFGINAGGGIGVGLNSSSVKQPNGIQLQYNSGAGLRFAFFNGENGAYLNGNAYYDGTWRYIAGSLGSAMVNANPNNGILFYTTSTTGSADGAISNWTEKMRIALNGNVGIGMTPGSYKLDVSGEIRATLNTQVDTMCSTNAVIGSCTSDGRLKTNIVNMEDNTLDEIMKLKPRYFDWINGAGTHQPGFIAQEVQAVLPDTFRGYTGDGYLKFSKDTLVPYLTKALQELNQISIKTDKNGIISKESFIFEMPEVEANTAQINNTGSIAVANTGFIINQKGSGNIIQFQQNGVDKLLITNNGSVHINSTIATGTVFEVTNNDTALLSIDHSGTTRLTGTLIVKKDLAVLGRILGSTAIVGKNTSNKTIHQGDLLMLTGATEEIILGDQPTITVSPAIAGEGILVGIADRNLSDFNLDPQGTITDDPTTIKPGEYLSIVITGTYKKVFIEGTISVGDKLTASRTEGKARKTEKEENSQIFGISLDNIPAMDGSIRVMLLNLYQQTPQVINQTNITNTPPSSEDQNPEEEITPPTENNPLEDNPQ